MFDPDRQPRDVDIDMPQTRPGALTSFHDREVPQHPPDAVGWVWEKRTFKGCSSFCVGAFERAVCTSVCMKACMLVGPHYARMLYVCAHMFVSVVVRVCLRLLKSVRTCTLS